jgi:hypothetical protein
VQFAQLEVGSLASSYIPTTGAAATRAIDNALNSILASIGFNPLEGTIYVEYELMNVSGNNRAITFDDGTNNNRITVNNFVGNANYSVRDGGVDQASLTAGSITAMTIVKQAAAYKANDFAVSVNGAAAVTDTLGSVATGITTLRFGQEVGGANNLFGWLRRVTYYPIRLPNAQLQALTA